MKRQLGGSYAPRITDSDLGAYKQALDTSKASPAILDAVKDLIQMVEVFYETPETSQPPEEDTSGRLLIRRLEEDEIARIWEVVPWDYEVRALRQLFEEIPREDAIHKAAHHLLWYAKELTEDREPVTRDRL